LTHAAGNQIDQNVGVANFLQCFFRQFGVQGFPKVMKSSSVN
jgi:hypothetical protein